MACTSPLTGYRSKFVNPETGKRPIVFNVKDAYTDLPVIIPCGSCWVCRLEYARQWAIRCVHEASLYEENCFITLTYNQENLPSDHSIHKEEVQKFFKRLRKRTGVKLRYFACGEYGEKSQRPHYHAIIFGYGFPDKVLFTKSNGHLLFRSETLEKCWTKGHSLIGGVTFESCGYVARYVMKKRKGDDDKVDPKTGKTNREYYLITDQETGETFEREREFCLQSRNPGLGKGWLEKFKSDTDKDFITFNGKQMPLPKYYDAQLEMEDAFEMLERKAKRKKEANKRKADNTPDRLATKNKIKSIQVEILKRNLEELDL